MVATEQILDAATEGDIPALKKLEKMCRRGQTIVRQALSIVSRHLQAPTPLTHPESHPLSSSSEPSIMEEIRAVLALNILDVASPDSEEGDAQSHPVYTLMLAQIDDIVRWMSHLFAHWVLDQSHHVEYAHTLNPPSSMPSQMDIQSMPSKIRSVVPSILETMSRHSETRILLRDDTRVGILMSQIFIVSTRDRFIDLLLPAREVYRNIRCGSDTARGEHSWETALSQNLKIQSHVVADDTLSWIKRLARDPISHLYVLLNVLGHLLTCTIQHDTVLDACLEHDDFILTLSSLFETLADVEHRGDSELEVNPQLSLRDAIPSLIYISHLLSASVETSGANIACAIIHYGILDSLLTLLDKFSLTQPGLMIPKPCDKSFGSIPLILVPLVVYPTVFYAAKAFFVNYEEGPPTRLPELEEAMGYLHTRMQEEFELVQENITSRHEATSEFSNPFKFCDNATCPSVRVGKIRQLGRCTACLSGYYCSRFCQKVMWKAGHREECQKVIDARYRGHPPLVQIHEREYFTRTLIPRLHYYIKLDSMEQPAEDSIVDIDLTNWPITVNYSTQETSSDGPTNPGPLIRAKFPTCEKLGDFVEITKYLDS